MKTKLDPALARILHHTLSTIDAMHPGRKPYRNRYVAGDDHE